jgi:hypothetical protein
VIFRTDIPRKVLDETVLAIPGTGWCPGYVTAAWDVAWRVGELLGAEVPPAPVDAGCDAPGMAEYERLGLREVLRNYQKEAALFLLRRAYCYLALPMRTGKTLVALSADMLVGSRWTLIVAPSLVKWVWADEILKWAKAEAIILEGRGGRLARQYCGTCRGRGNIAGPDDEEPVWCPDCTQLNGQSYGYRIHEVRTVSKPVRAPKIELPKPLRSRRRKKRVEHAAVRVNLMSKEPFVGPPYPTARDIEEMRRRRDEYYATFDEGLYCCSKHPEVQSHDPKGLCLKCRGELLTLLRNARYIIANYDILIAQDQHDEAGGFVGMRLDLPGWAPVLSHLDIDVAILDEAHVFRGRPQKKRRGRTRRDRLIDVVRRVRRVWLLTGTPIYGYTRDLWSPFDVASDGLWGRPWYDFDTRYCEGRINAHGGWEANGRSLLAESELKRRLGIVMLKKERSEILPELPPKERQVIRLEPKEALPPIDTSGTKRDIASRELARALEHKLVDIVDKVIDDMAEGNKVLVFTWLRASAERVFRAIEGKMRSPQVGVRMRQVNTATWLAHGEVSDKARFDVARDFREHAGAGALVSTTDAMQVGISLFGATSMYFAELHPSPAAMLQAEDRPYEPGVTSFCAYYCVLKGSIDEHVEAMLLPKFETQVLLTDDEGAKDARAAFKDEEESIEQIVDRLTAHLKLEDG